MVTDRYYYHRFPEEKRRIYRAIYKGAKDRIPSVLLQGTVDMDTVMEVYSAVLLDNPMLYYLSRKVEILQYSGAVCRTEIKMHYTLSRETIQDFDRRIEDGVNSLIEDLGLGKMRDRDAVKTLHDYLAAEMKYDSEALRNRKKGRLISAHSVIGFFSKQSAVCDGISCTAKLVLNALNIPCIVVAGSAEPEDGSGHAWNIVKIGDEAYHLDITWDINMSTRDKICYDYYNIPDEAARRDHKWPPGLPKCSSWEENLRVRSIY